MLGFSFSFRFRSRLIRLPGFGHCMLTCALHFTCCSFDECGITIFFGGLSLGSNVLRVRSDAAHNLGGVTHVQTLSVTDGSDLRVPSSHSKQQHSSSFI